MSSRNLERCQKIWRFLSTVNLITLIYFIMSGENHYSRGPEHHIISGYGEEEYGSLSKFQHITLVSHIKIISLKCHMYVCMYIMIYYGWAYWGWSNTQLTHINKSFPCYHNICSNILRNMYSRVCIGWFWRILI